MSLPGSAISKEIANVRPGAEQWGVADKKKNAVLGHL